MIFRQNPLLWLTAHTVIGTALPNTVFAAQDMARLCDAAAIAAADEFAIPQDLLLAIIRVETGRDGDDGLHPWPWTLNQNGKEAWFETQEDAVAAAEAALAEGAENVDIGCFQLNHRWHGAAFDSVAAMIDPESNARYAAGFLTDLYAQEGDWSAAVAAYHSRTEAQGDRYLALVESVLANLPESSATETRSENRFPLLQAGVRGCAGSIVPQLASAGRLIGGAP